MLEQGGAQRAPLVLDPLDEALAPVGLDHEGECCALAHASGVPFRSGARLAGAARADTGRCRDVVRRL
nr:hypothetical protein KitaXyl93_54970 [Kitasatospora sp. Xyl93]